MGYNKVHAHCAWISVTNWLTTRSWIDMLTMVHKALLDYMLTMDHVSILGYTAEIPLFIILIPQYKDGLHLQRWIAGMR
jgi:hypothetical protein